METSKAMTKGMNKINDVKSSLFLQRNWDVSIWAGCNVNNDKFIEPQTVKLKSLFNLNKKLFFY